MTTTKEAEREELIEQINQELHERLERMASHPDQWLEFIDQVATFGAQYALGNQILLWWQAQQRGVEPQYFLPYGRKDGSTGWLSKGRQVRKGEKSYKIWAPIKRRPTEEEVARWAATGRTVQRDRNGHPAYRVVGWTLASTFELGQTDGAPFEVPSVQIRRRLKIAGHSPELLTGEDPTGAFDDTVKLIKDAGYSFELVAPGTGHLSGPYADANGITVRDLAAGVQAVQVRNDVSDAQRVKTTVHELAHVRCGHLDDGGYGEHRGRRETEAESVAHIVTKALGLDSAPYTDAYVLTWANGDLDMIKECAETVLRVAKDILADLDPAHDEQRGEPSARDARVVTGMGNPTPADVSSGAYTLTRSPYGGGEVYRNGERIGHFWPDKYGGYAVFRTGNSKPIARLKTEAGCVRKLTNGAFNGTG